MAKPSSYLQSERGKLLDGGEVRKRLAGIQQGRCEIVFSSWGVKDGPIPAAAAHIAGQTKETGKTMVQAEKVKIVILAFDQDLSRLRHRYAMRWASTYCGRRYMNEMEKNNPDQDPIDKIVDWDHRDRLCEYGILDDRADVQVPKKLRRYLN